MSVWTTVAGWFGFGGALGEGSGQQSNAPSTALVSDTALIGADGALQLSAVWACVDRRATTVASLPFFAYLQRDGQKELARDSRLYGLLHDSPNRRMTPFEFWRAMMLNHDLRGNAYARIDRDERTGEAIALWPMPADQVVTSVLRDGSMVYAYHIDGNVAVFPEENVLHLKNLGNGTTGLAKLEFMRATTDEMAKAQQSAAQMFGNGGKPTGVLMIDKLLTPEQRAQIRENFGGLTTGSTSRLMVLEAAMTYQQLSLTPEQMQTIDARKHGVEEFCRWLDVPPVLIHHSNVTAWGSGIEQIVDGFHKFTIRPILVSIEQAVRKRVMTPKQRATMSIEFNLDALLRGSLKDRMAVYAQGVQNGVTTRNECRQLENLPPIKGGDELTAQSNLVPLHLMGQVKPASGTAPPEPVAQ